MDRRRVMELVMVGLWLIIAVVLFLHYNRDKTATPLPDKLAAPVFPDAQKGKKYDVRTVIVLRGDTFDLTIKDKDNSRVMGKLPVVATENAKQKVLDQLNHSTNPKVVLREKQPDGRWTIDFFFTSNGKEVNLVEWLGSNNLVYK